MVCSLPSKGLLPFGLPLWLTNSLRYVPAGKPGRHSLRHQVEDLKIVICCTACSDWKTGQPFHQNNSYLAQGTVTCARFHCSHGYGPTFEHQTEFHSVNHHVC